MKISVIVIVTSLCFASCTSAFETDVREMARLTCEIQKLSMKAIKGEAGAEQELQIKEEQARKLEEEMIKKYAKNKDDMKLQEKGNRIFEEELKKCMKEK